MSKSGIGLKLRRRVYERDAWTCQYCGSKHDLGIDHIIPRSLGGGDQEDNLRTACQSCNSTKKDRGVEWFRLFIAFQSTKYAPHITLEQYHRLRGLGVVLDDLSRHVFFFEADA